MSIESRTRTTMACHSARCVPILHSCHTRSSVTIKLAEIKKQVASHYRDGVLPEGARFLKEAVIQAFSPAGATGAGSSHRTYIALALLGRLFLLTPVSRYFSNQCRHTGIHCAKMSSWRGLRGGVVASNFEPSWVRGAILPVTSCRIMSCQLISPTLPVEVKDFMRYCTHAFLQVIASFVRSR